MRKFIENKTQMISDTLELIEMAERAGRTKAVEKLQQFVQRHLEEADERGLFDDQEKGGSQQVRPS
eukprot:12412100-Karenia_brevis.AAC.1